MLPERHLHVLDTLAGRLDKTIVWALTGSTAFVLQGVPVEPHDIDVQTDAAGAGAIAARFSQAIVQPVAFSGTDRVRSYFGALELHGLRVEIMGALQKRQPDGSWETPVDVVALRRWITVGGLRLPVLDLAYEARAYRLLGRVERADLLEAWLRAQGRGESR
jgi:hypothetical protein